MKSTITIDKELRKELENLKGEKTWEEFVRELIEVYEKNRKKNIKKKIKKLYELVDIEEVEKMKILML